MPSQIEEEIPLLCRVVVCCGQLAVSCLSARTLTLMLFGKGARAAGTEMITAQPLELGNHQPHQRNLCTTPEVIVTHSMLLPE